ncbi:hypothetical protein P691DRAFT_106576 [Macrolepiota fuliginosa MF-IS2]|uniref:Uncharacterized protein n=1 Tax=Macrolepiota fuliginosa MF-IS2 TaxID=1400762 RepID=A0A9P5WWT6_9AGAR|nr:hypothetical protein P691DRAFT_106576 [Macrolepiota fuliginosa MF-IS2]
MLRKWEWTTSRLANAKSNIYLNLSLSYPSTNPRLPPSSDPGSSCTSPPRRTRFSKVPPLRIRNKQHRARGKSGQALTRALELSGEIAGGRRVPPNTRIL